MDSNFIRILKGSSANPSNVVISFLFAVSVCMVDIPCSTFLLARPNPRSSCLIRCIIIFCISWSVALVNGSICSSILAGSSLTFTAKSDALEWIIDEVVGSTLLVGYSTAKDRTQRRSGAHPRTEPGARQRRIHLLQLLFSSGKVSST
jgi:hypothetical protein